MGNYPGFEQIFDTNFTNLHEPVLKVRVIHDSGLNRYIYARSQSDPRSYTKEHKVFLVFLVFVCLRVASWITSGFLAEGPL
jgi:hypothetical protein